MMKTLSKFLILGAVVMALTACTDGQSSNASVDTLITLMQSSQPVLELGTMPLRFYCVQNRWPETVEVLNDSKNRTALSMVYDFKSMELRPRGYQMKFRLISQENREHPPLIIINIPITPKSDQCITKNFSFNDVKISIAQKEQENQQ
jgi:hypothetical protein